MQYHLNGFNPGDPGQQPVAPGVEEGETTHQVSSPSEVDVLIVGCGPAGLTLAAQLAAFPEISTRIVEQKLGPLQFGQADGVACRSMEMFEAFGFAGRVLKESYWVNETVFWRPDPENPDRIARADRIQDVEDGLSEFPHTILSQARIHDFYLDTMLASPRRLVPDYGRRFIDYTVDDDSTSDSHPVTATLGRIDPGHQDEIETVRARFLVGCDGARSAVRRSLGAALRGDNANKLWGVADLLAVTDFPDIRLKAAIQSTNDGSVLIIPREGGYMFRMYTELGELEPGERASDRAISPDDIVAAAQRVLAPYTLDVKEIPWWSVYEIGQRLSETFTDATGDADGDSHPRVFITGDACHTHSPKAGQGMNVGMADSFNLGWKLASVLLGRCVPDLLETYSTERRQVAEELIDFDRDMEKLFVARANASKGSNEAQQHQAKFQEYFTKHARFTAGVETLYAPSLITVNSPHQHLATGFTIGKRFHSEAVIRLGDAKPTQLGHSLKADGRWRLFAFAGATDPTAPTSNLARFCSFLETNPNSPVVRYTPRNADIDAVIDVRAVCQQHHRELALDAMPSLLLPRKGKLGLIDYEKIFCPDVSPGADIFSSRGVNRTEGCVVVVRPDQHVAQIVPLADHSGLSGFFEAFMVSQTPALATSAPALG